MVNGKRERPTGGHVPEDPSAGGSSHGPGQKRISSDRPVIQVEVADVVAFEVQPGVVTIDMDLDLE